MPLWRRAFDWWLVQLKHVLPPTIFFFFGFNLILFTRWMTLQEHGIPFTNFFGATLAALLVGKAVLVVDNLRLMHRFDGAPLIQPILFKSVIYWVCVFVFRIAEGMWHFVLDGGAPGDFPSFLVAQFSWPRFLAIQIWLMVLFLVYVTAHELNTLFGDGELPRLFLRWHASEAKLTKAPTHPPADAAQPADRGQPGRSHQREGLSRKYRAGRDSARACGAARRGESWSGARQLMRHGRIRTAAMAIDALRLVVAITVTH